MKIMQESQNLRRVIFLKTFHIFKGDKTTVVQVSGVAHKRTSYC